MQQLLHLYFFVSICSVLIHKSKQIYNEHGAVLCVCSRLWQFFRRRHRQTLRRFGRDGQEHAVQKILCESWQNYVVWTGKHDGGPTDLESVYAARHHVYFATIKQIAFQALGTHGAIGSVSGLSFGSYPLGGSHFERDRESFFDCGTYPAGGCHLVGVCWFSMSR